MLDSCSMNEVAALLNVLLQATITGGVATTSLKAKLAEACDKLGVELIVPPLSLCTDNAAMAALAVEKLARGEFAPADLDAEPNFI